MSARPAARRALAVAVAGVGWYLSSCREVPAPEGGVSAISPLVLPLPGLVAGDTMRDSTGIVAPLRVVAYGSDGEPMNPQPPATFVVLDTTAHLANALLIGDRAGTTARVVGVVGPIQTRPEIVKVTLAPDTLVQSDSTLHRLTYSVTADTVVNSAELAVLVQHLLPSVSGVEAVVVNYTIDRAPPGNSTPTLVLMDGTRASSRDTTDQVGKASRAARLRLQALNTFQAETALVSARASYRGRVLGVVSFTIIYTKQ